jgi:hypothetical protein
VGVVVEERGRADGAHCHLRHRSAASNPVGAAAVVAVPDHIQRVEQRSCSSGTNPDPGYSIVDGRNCSYSSDDRNQILYSDDDYC